MNDLWVKDDGCAFEPIATVPRTGKLVSGGIHRSHAKCKNKLTSTSWYDKVLFQRVNFDGCSETEEHSETPSSNAMTVLDGWIMLAVIIAQVAATDVS